MTREEIKGWLELGIVKGVKYVMVFCDTFDYTYYPVYIKDPKEVSDRYNRAASGKGDRLMEVYDLSLDIDTQLQERRAMHLPQ